MNIRLIRTPGLDKSFLQKVLKILQEHEGPMQFSAESSHLDFDIDKFWWDSLFEKCAEYRTTNGIDKDDFLVVLTELRNHKNWFSQYNKERSMFIHAADWLWERYAPDSPEYPVAYQVVENVLGCFLHTKEIKDFQHQESIACISDFCRKKDEVALKLQSGQICSDCSSLFTESIGEDYLSQALSVLESVKSRISGDMVEICKKLSDKIENFTEIEWAGQCNRKSKLDGSHAFPPLLSVFIIFIQMLRVSSLDPNDESVRASWFVVIFISFLIFGLFRVAYWYQSSVFQSTIYGADWQHLYIYQEKNGKGEVTEHDLNDFSDVSSTPYTVNLHTHEKTLTLYVFSPRKAHKEIARLMEKRNNISAKKQSTSKE